MSQFTDTYRIIKWTVRLYVAGPNLVTVHSLRHDDDDDDDDDDDNKEEVNRTGSVPQEQRRRQPAAP